MYPLFLSGFNKTWIFSKDFRKKWSNIKFHAKSVQWEPRCYMRTDVHDEATSRFSEFCERAKRIDFVLQNQIEIQ